MAGPLRILHLANHKSTNIGNGALILGLERTLTEDFETPVAFTGEAWDDYTIPGATKRFDHSFVEKCNQGFDCLLIGAAVTMDGAKRYSATGMRFDLDLTLWDKIRCPIVFYGISHRTWSNRPYHHLERLGQTIRFALSHDRVFFSVRNDGTREWLESTFQLSAGTIREVPDPALFVGTEAMPNPHIDADVPTIAVSLNDEDAPQRFGQAVLPAPQRALIQLLPERRRRRVWERLARHKQRRKAFLRTLAAVLDELHRSSGANIVLCPHHLEDYAMVADLGRLATSHLKHQVLTSYWLPKAVHAKLFYSLYTQVDMVWAMRVHALTPSLGLGTPTIALSSQSRLSEFMRRADLEDLSLDIFSPSFAQDLQRLAAEVLKSPRAYRERIRAAVARFREDTRATNREIEEFVLKSVKSQ